VSHLRMPASLPFAVPPFNASVELSAPVTVTFTALVADTFAALTTLTGFTLLTFPALSAFLALPVVAAVVVVDLRDIARHSRGSRRSLNGRGWRAS
jgi:hypothetical protein